MLTTTSGLTAGAEPPTGDTTEPTMKDSTQNQDQQQRGSRLVGRLQRLVGRAISPFPLLSNEMEMQMWHLLIVTPIDNQPISLFFQTVLPYQ